MLDSIILGILVIGGSVGAFFGPSALDSEWGEDGDGFLIPAITTLFGGIIGVIIAAAVILGFYYLSVFALVPIGAIIARIIHDHNPYFFKDMIERLKK